VKYGDGTISKLEAFTACDDAGAAIERLRELTDKAESYGMEPFVKSFEEICKDMDAAMMRLADALGDIAMELPDA
jgi:hypothetical protein